MPHKKAKRSTRLQTAKEKGTDNAPSGADAIQNEVIPKAFARVLNAEKIRDDFHIKQKKRKLDGEEGAGDRPGKKKKTTTAKKGGEKTADAKKELKILPGESLAHFNKRVESDLRPLMRDAAKSSFATTRKADKDAITSSKSKSTSSTSTSKSTSSSKSDSKSSKSDSKSSKSDYKSSKSKPSADSDSDSPPRDKHANKAKEFATLQSSAPKRLNDIAQAPPEFKKIPVRGVKAGGGMKSDGVLSLAQNQMMEEERENAVRRYRELKARQKAAA